MRDSLSPCGAPCKRTSLALVSSTQTLLKAPSTGRFIKVEKGTLRSTTYGAALQIGSNISNTLLGLWSCQSSLWRRGFGDGGVLRVRRHFDGRGDGRLSWLVHGHFMPSGEVYDVALFHSNSKSPAARFALHCPNGLLATRPGKGCSQRRKLEMECSFRVLGIWLASAD